MSWENKKYLADRIFYDVFIDKVIDEEKTLIVPNSLVFRLFVKMFTRKLTGAQAISDIDVIESLTVNPIDLC